MSVYHWTRQTGFVAFALATPALSAVTPATSLAVVSSDFGLTSTALAACGFDVRSATALLDAMEKSDHLEAYMSARSSVVAAEKAVNQASLDERHDELAAVTAQATLAQAQISLDLARQAIQAEILASVEQSHRERLSNWWSAPSDLPTEMRITPLADNELDAVRSAILVERVPATASEDERERAKSTLAAIRSRPEVVAAQQALKTQEPALAALLSTRLRM